MVVWATSTSTSISQLFILLTSVAAVQHTFSSPNPSETPPLVRFASGGNAKVLFQVDATLTGCECRVYENKHSKGPLLNFSLGVQSPRPPRYEKYTARYHGGGLNHGQCGVHLSEVSFRSRLLLCRFRSERGGWQYKQANLLQEVASRFPLTTAPLHMALPDTDASLLCTASDVTLNACSVWLPYVASWRTFTANALRHGGRYTYYGAGLREGECGVTVTRVTHDDSGVVWCGAKAGVVDSLIPTILIVAAPPDSVSLVVSSTTLNVGDILTATCTLSAHRPLANLTWLLGDHVIRQDQLTDLAVAHWYLPWELQSITQTVALVMTSDDHGKQIQCQVEHLAMEGGKREARTITIENLATKMQLNASDVDNGGIGEVNVCIPEIDTTSSCGIVGGSSPELVAGGSDALPGEYPWQAGIYVRIPDGGYMQLCGGTLVSIRMVITAAHCFKQKNSTNNSSSEFMAAMYNVTVGKVQRDWNTFEAGEQKRAVSEIIVHPRYKDYRVILQHDIAIVLLATSVLLSPTVNTACVDWSNAFDTIQLAEGRSGIATGWGFTETGLTSSATLKAVSLPWVSEETCRVSLPTNSTKYYTHDKFCAGYRNANRSVCPGDSGGGILFEDFTSHRFYLRGVVSVSFAPSYHNRLEHGCYKDNYTGFTKLATYLQWISKYFGNTASDSTTNV